VSPDQPGSAAERVQINLPELYARINEQRLAGGLPQVEPAIMAVRSTIKFSIRRGRTLKLRGDAVDAEHDDVEALCAVLSDLFNVQVKPVDELDGRAVRVLGLARAPTWALPMSRLYDAVNSGRAEKGLPSVESAVISVRTRVRYSVVRSKPLNFKDDRLIVDDQDREFLDDFIASHFNVEIPGGVAALCVEAKEVPPSRAPGAERRLAGAEKERSAHERRRLRERGGPALELSMPRLLESINRLRQDKGLPLVEPAVISVRTRVRYSIVRKRPLDFKGDLLQIDDDDREFLDIFITQHFDVSIPGGIAALCESGAATQAAVIEAAAPAARAKNPVSPVWRYLTELWRLAKDGPLTRVNLDRLAESITLRMHGQPSEARTRDVRRRLGEVFGREVAVESNDADGVVWMTRAQLSDAASAIRRDFPIQLTNLRDLLS